MKRETFNTIIALLGLALAAFSTFNQLRPEKDVLDFSTQAGFDSKDYFKLARQANLPKEIFGENTKLAGPAFIRLEIANNMNRPVTVKKINLTFINKNNNELFYSSLFDGEGGSDAFLSNIPVTLAEHTVKNINMSINIPIFYKEDFAECFENKRILKGENKSVNEVEYCYYSKGKDLIGNAINMQEFKNGGVIITKNEQSKALNYKVTLITGDNTEISRMATIH